jgi:transcription elongation factor Elf1
MPSVENKLVYAKADPKQYKICRARGHTADGTSFDAGQDLKILTCRFCQVSYYITVVETINELNAPNLMQSITKKGKGKEKETEKSNGE